MNPVRPPTCPRCGLVLDETGYVSAGDVLFSVERRALYRVTESTRPRDQGTWASAKKLRKQEHDPEPDTIAIWPDKVRTGQWLRVANPAPGDRAPDEKGEER